MDQKKRVSGISTREMSRRTEDSGSRIIDIRPIDAYNGWRLGGETRGGHI
ncbi:MAG: hypothetical protein GF392_01590, partial [Candidatus Omnitrophica bacterium]|nr:hypothetical protein [Candidatus Omnitrophota bacterium]